MELFTIGKCNLNLDGSLVGGKCTAPYDNATVTANAAALSGWTYPVGGGQTPMWCYSNTCADGRNPPYYNGRMLSVQSRHDIGAQSLLSGVQLPANSTPEQAVEKVLDSVMAHPNIAPFVSRTLIQFLVTSNPPPAYIERVAKVFNAGRYLGVGSGVKGDLKAVVTAILLDDEARNPVTAAGADYGRLREGPLAATAALRAMGSTSDGIRIDGSLTRNSLFDADTVFNFFPSVFSVPGSPELNGPEFKVQTVQATYDRSNFMSWLLMTQQDGLLRRLRRVRRADRDAGRLVAVRRGCRRRPATADRPAEHDADRQHDVGGRPSDHPRRDAAMDRGRPGQHLLVELRQRRFQLAP